MHKLLESLGLQLSSRNKFYSELLFSPSVCTQISFPSSGEPVAFHTLPHAYKIHSKRCSKNATEREGGAKTPQTKQKSKEMHREPEGRAEKQH